MKREKRRTEKIEAAVRLKRQLVSALAHDIKTPLNVILGYAELLAEPSISYSTPKERLSCLECIRKNVDRITKMITDFLDVSKLETMKLDGAKDLVQMNVIAEEVVLQQMVTAQEKEQILALKLDANLEPILGDFDQLQRVLWNLVSNAIKFTPTGGQITVTSAMTKKNIAIKVKDTGIGVAKDEISSLFSEFRRLDGAANIEGTGLGLFIVKTIVESHGGSVAVEANLAKGQLSRSCCRRLQCNLKRYLGKRLSGSAVQSDFSFILPSKFGNVWSQRGNGFTTRHHAPYGLIAHKPRRASRASPSNRRNSSIRENGNCALA